MQWSHYGRAHRSHRWGAGAERAQWAMQRGGGVLSKGASGDHCEVDRASEAQRDHRFESCCDHQKPLKTLCFRGFSFAYPPYRWLFVKYGSLSNVGVRRQGEKDSGPESIEVSEAKSDAFQSLDGVVAALRSVICRRCVQILRFAGLRLRCAQDDRTLIRGHPERKVGNPEGFQVRPVGRTADFQSRGLKTAPREGSVRFVIKQRQRGKPAIRFISFHKFP